MKTWTAIKYDKPPARTKFPIRHPSPVKDAIRDVSARTPSVPAAAKDIITYWYRRNPSNSGSSGGTTGNNPSLGQPVLNPGIVSQDKVFLTILVMEPSSLDVKIGAFPPTTLRALTAGISHFSVPFNGQTGPVKMTISRSGQEIVSTTGPDITDQCVNGEVNWNAFVGSS